MTAAADVALILLAAGRSTRFGSDKLLHPLDGEMLGVRAAAMLSSFAFAAHIAVCRTTDGALPDALAQRGYEVVQSNGELSRSLAAGVRVVLPSGSRACLVCLADMPFVTHAHIDAVLAALPQSASGVVASTAGAAPGPPALFDRRHFERLARLSGDQGARPLLAVATSVHAEATVLRDIDRPEDLALVHV